MHNYLFSLPNYLGNAYVILAVFRSVSIMTPEQSWRRSLHSIRTLVPLPQERADRLGYRSVTAGAQVQADLRFLEMYLGRGTFCQQDCL